MSASKKLSVVSKMQEVKINSVSHPTIDAAFAERPDLKQRIYNTIRKSPRSSKLSSFLCKISISRFWIFSFLERLCDLR